MPQYMDYEGFKAFVESHFPDKVTVDKRELEHGLYHELAIMEH